MALQRLNLFSNDFLLKSCRLFSVTSTTAKSLSKWYKELWTPKSANTPPYNHFTQVGDPVLRSQAGQVPQELINSPELDLIVDRMIKVMRKFECVGIAAPQIGVSLRIIVMEFPDRLKTKYTQEVYKARKMATMPLKVFINPTLKVTGYEKNKHPEGCMSVRGYSADVERFDKVTLTGVGRLGIESTVQLSGWNARIAQHEMDHLEGKLYIDHMDRSTFICTCWEAVNAKCGRVEIPFYK